MSGHPSPNIPSMLQPQTHWAWTMDGATDGETDMDTETDVGISESDYEVGSIGQSHNPGESKLFLPGNTVFWFPYALSAYIL